ncbi:MAG: DUF1385 domain-containing protein [Oscillospiraceae bacterium]|nr:DUF1385 domain-containing protein [Oscillospiraceae bacterium]
MEQRKTTIGGQALIEGIVMRGKNSAALAVRLPNGQIDIEEKTLKPIREKYKILGLPIIRGAVNFVETLIFGYQCLMESAEKSGMDDMEAESKFDKWLEEHIGDKLMAIVGVVSAVLGVALSLVLFMYLPSFLVDIFDKYVTNNVLDAHRLHPLFEGIIKIIVFVLYMVVVAQMPDIKRVFMYHGAEHKTIFCYENGLPLTVENVRKQSRFHPRCGTSFMFVMMIISIFISTALIVVFPSLSQSRPLWVLAKLLVLPLVMGIGYEFIKYAGRHDNVFTKITSAPGLWMQRISTVEPTDDMIEVGIAAFNRVLEMEPDCDVK